MNVHEIVRRGFSIGMVQIETEVMQLAGFLAALRPGNLMEIGTDRAGLFYVFTQLATGVKISLDLPGGPFGSLPLEAVEERDLDLFLLVAQGEDSGLSLDPDELEDVGEAEVLDAAFECHRRRSPAVRTGAAG